MNDDKLDIKLKIAGKSYSMRIDPRKEEIYRLAGARGEPLRNQIRAGAPRRIRSGRLSSDSGVATRGIEHPAVAEPRNRQRGVEAAGGTRERGRNAPRQIGGLRFAASDGGRKTYVMRTMPKRRERTGEKEDRGSLHICNTGNLPA